MEHLMSIQGRDIYTWSVVCADGSTLKEYDRPDGHGFVVTSGLQVKQLKISSFIHTYAVEIPEGATPVFFRRRRLEISPIDERVSQKGTTHCIGWKQGEQSVYLFVFEDGSTLLTDDLQAV